MKPVESGKDKKIRAKNVTANGYLFAVQLDIFTGLPVQKDTTQHNSSAQPCFKSRVPIVDKTAAPHHHGDAAGQEKKRKEAGCFGFQALHRSRAGGLVNTIVYVGQDKRYKK